jgi:hypothetical protein
MDWLHNSLFEEIAQKLGMANYDKLPPDELMKELRDLCNRNNKSKEFAEVEDAFKKEGVTSLRLAKATANLYT